MFVIPCFPSVDAISSSVDLANSLLQITPSEELCFYQPPTVHLDKQVAILVFVTE